MVMRTGYSLHPEDCKTENFFWYTFLFGIWVGFMFGLVCGQYIPN